MTKTKVVVEPKRICSYTFIFRTVPIAHRWCYYRMDDADIERQYLKDTGLEILSVAQELKGETMHYYVHLKIRGY